MTLLLKPTARSSSAKARRTNECPHSFCGRRPPRPKINPALDWILIGDGLNYDSVLLRAWDIASGMGLGPARRRFHIRACRGLDPAGNLLSAMANSGGWRLFEAFWPLPGPPDSTPCRLRFPAPLRLLRLHRLIEQPTLADVVVAALRRLEAFLPTPASAALARIKPALLEQARIRPGESWRGRRLDLVRYFGRQKTELEMRGVSGYLDLPDGPVPLWPLLAAAPRQGRGGWDGPTGCGPTALSAGAEMALPAQT